MAGSSRAIDLVVNVTSKVDDAVGGLDRAGAAAEDMSRRVDDAGAVAEKAGRRLSVTADGADHLATKSSIATGALGALSSGFELVGLEKYAGGLQAAALGTDFLSGVGDSLTLVMESQAVMTARARVATIAHGIAARATAAAQWVLNAAMSANPVMLVVLAIAALVAAFVIAYRRSERFREIVQAVGRAGRAAIGWVVDRVRELVGWVRDRVPAAARRMQQLGDAAWRKATAPIKALRDTVSSTVVWVRDRLTAAFGTIRDKAVSIGEKLTRPFRSLWDLIQKIIDKIGSIRLPKLPSLGGLGFRASGITASRSLVVAAPRITAAGVGGPASSGSSSSGVGDTYYEITVNGAVDAEATARQLRRILERSARRRGGLAVI